MLEMPQLYAKHPDFHKGRNCIYRYSDIEVSCSYFKVKTRKINEIINIAKLFWI
jgi:hypothetical protein